MAELDLTLGAIVISTLFSFLATGITLTGTWSYYSRFTKDNLAFKLLVAVCLVLTVTDTVVGGYWCYTWTVTHYADPNRLLNLTFIPVTFTIQVSILGFVSLFVQIFFAWRLWIVTLQKNFWLPGVIVCLAVMAWSVIMWVTSIVATHHDANELGVVLPTAYVWLAGSIAADLLISLGLFYYLYFRFRQRNIHREMKSMNIFKSIIVRTVQCNVLSLVAQVTTIVLFTTQVGYYYFLPDFTISKVYFFSLLVSLNSRKPHTITDQTLGFGEPTSPISDANGGVPVFNKRHHLQISMQTDFTSDMEVSPSDSDRSFGMKSLKAEEV